MEKVSPGVESTMKEQPSEEFNLSGELNRPDLTHIDGRGGIAEGRVCAARGERFSFARVKEASIRLVQESDAGKTVRKHKKLLSRRTHEPWSQKRLQARMNDQAELDFGASTMGEESRECFSHSGVKQPAIVPKGSTVAVAEKDSRQGAIPRQLLKDKPGEVSAGDAIVVLPSIG